MPRNQIIVKFPTLNDKRGDLSKKWYVEYFYRIPGNDVPRKRRISEGLCTGTAAERYANAKRIIATVTKMLKDPQLLTMRPDDVTRVLTDDTVIRPEADRYAQYKHEHSAAYLTARYLDYIRPAVAQKTYETYKSKFKYYCEWLADHQKPCIGLEHEDVLQLFRWLADERRLTKRSILKYKQILHTFYEWLIQSGTVYVNPIHDIPNYGKIVDHAPVPVGENERKVLKSVISSHDPYLWLACEIQYYCAIRPGTELRLLQVRDIDLEHRQITIPAEHAKNRCKDVVPINEQVAEQIRRLGIMSYAPEMYVFGTYNVPSAKPMGKNTLRNRFNKYRDDLGISKRIKFYSWKHTGAISMVENGASVWQVQAHMRHASITTTEDYIRQRASQSRSAVALIDEL